MGVGAMKLLSIPLSLATSIILARILGPESFGQYAFIMALVPLLALPVSGGLPQLLTREIATFAFAERWSLYKGALRTAHSWVLAISFAILGVIWALAGILDVIPIEGKWALLPIATFIIPFMGLGAVRMGAIKGLGMPGYAELPQLIIQPLFILMLVGSATVGGILNPHTAIWIQVLGAGLTFIVASFLFLHLQPNTSRGYHCEYEVKRWASALFPFSLLALVSTFNSQIGIAILGLLGSDEDVAAMRVAERSGNLVILSLNVVNMVLAPYIVRAYQSQDKKLLQEVVTRAARGSFLLALPLALILIFSGNEIIRFFFGDEYSEIAYWPLFIVVVAQLFNVFCGSVGMVLSMSGNEKLTLIGQSSAVVLNVTLCIILIPTYGAIGAALGVSAALVMWNLLLVAFLRKKLGIRAGAI